MTGRLSNVVEIGPRGKAAFRDKLELDGYVAEFYVNPRHLRPVYHYLISPKGSRSIEIWGQSHSLETARQEAENALRFVRDSNRQKRAA